MIEKQMLKVLLGKKFYTQYKGQVSRNVFQGSFGSLFETIQKAHDEYEYSTEDSNRIYRNI